MKYRLSDISTIISGGTPKKKVKEYWNGSIPWITIKDFNAKKTNSFTNYISEKGLNNSSANLTKENDILISSRGTVGKLLMVKSGMAFNQSIYDIRTDTKKVNSDYLYYWLYKNIEEIKQKVHGSVFDTITRETFDLIEIALPDLSVQSEISSKIKVIDEKIEANQQINDNLLEIAMNMFKKNFNNYGSLHVSDYLLPKRGKALLKSDVIAGDIPVVAGGLHPAAYHNQSNTMAPVITISSSGANAGYIQLWGEEVWSSDSSYIDESITNDIYFWYLLLKNSQKQIFDSQTGSAQPHIYPKHIGNLLVPRFNNIDVKNFNISIEPLFKKIFQNNSENKKLNTLKSILLNRFF